MRLEAQQRVQVAVLEDDFATPNAAPVASRLVSTPAAASSGAWSANSSSRNPSPSTTPITSGCLGGQGVLEVVVFGDRAADQRPHGQRGAEAVDRLADGGVGRVLLGDRRDQRVAAASGWAGTTCPIRVALSDRVTCTASPAGTTICSGPVAPGPIAACTCP